MRIRWSAAVAAVGVLVAVAGCTSSGSTGSRASGPGSAGSGATSATTAPVSSPGSPAVSPSVSPSVSPAVSPSTPPAASASPAAALPSTPAALRAFVLAGVRADGTRYDVSAAAAGEPLRSDGLGELTFTSPSGNIACTLRPAAAGLDPQAVCWVQNLAQRTPRPAGCEHDWVPGVVDVVAGHVDVGACLGGIPFGPYARVLGYGSTLVLGPVGCRSDARFVACADLTSGIGFRADRTVVTPVRA